MDYLLVPLLAAVTLLAAGYTHFRLPYHTRNSRQLWMARIFLAMLGLGFGWATVSTYVPVAGAMQLWVFLASFGVVHVPAAFILFIKRQRNEPA